MSAGTIELWQKSWLGSRDDPYLFATGVLGIPEPGAEPVGDLQPMEPWQAKVFQAIRDGKKRISIRSGHGCKKSATLSILVLWGLLTHRGCKIPVVAGGQSQLVDTIWPEIAIWWRRLPEPLRDQIDIQKERVVVKVAPDEAFAVARTASKDNPQAMAGFHAPFLMFLVDEASGVSEAAYEVAIGALSTEGAIAILAGNPTKASGFFFDTHNKLRSRWHCVHVSSEDVPTARGHIDDIIQRYGRNSNAYRVRVLGEFPTQDDETVIPLELVLAARGRDIAKSDVWPVWGVDVARHGDDRTVVVRRQGNTILGAPVIWQNLDLRQVAGRIVELYRATLNNEKPREIIIDVIGMGYGVYDILRSPGGEVRELVRGCNVSEQPANSERFARLRDEIWFKGRDWFAEKDCHIPTGLPNPPENEAIEEMIAELTAATYDFTANGKVVVERKADMKKRGLRSPDIADAFLLTLAGGIYPRTNPHRRRHDSQSEAGWLGA